LRERGSEVAFRRLIAPLVIQPFLAADDKVHLTVNSHYTECVQVAVALGYYTVRVVVVVVVV